MAGCARGGLSIQNRSFGNSKGRHSVYRFTKSQADPCCASELCREQRQKHSRSEKYISIILFGHYGRVRLGTSESNRARKFFNEAVPGHAARLHASRCTAWCGYA